MAEDPAFSRYEKMLKDAAPVGEPSGALFVVAEKIHGANMTVIATPSDGVRYARRTGIIGHDEAFFEYQQLVPWLTPAAASLCKMVKDAAEVAGTSLIHVDIVGELYGGLWPAGAATCAAPVQSKPPIFYSPRLEFAAFDVAVTLDGRKRRYLDWPIARLLLAKAGVPVAPEFGHVSRSAALHWPLPFHTKVPEHLGLALPEGETRGLAAEGVVVKCEVERSPVWRPVRAALAEAAGILVSTSGDHRRWVRLSRVMDGEDDGEPEEEELDAEAESAGAAASGAGAAGAAASGAAGGAVATGRGSKRWIAKVKCSRFVETHSAKGADDFRPSKALKVPAAGLMVQVYRRLTDARAAAAQSKVGAPPPGAGDHIYVAIGRVRGRGGTGTAGGEAGGDAADADRSAAWAVEVAALIMEDLAEELGLEHAEGMGSCWRKPLDLATIDAPATVMEAAARGVAVGLPPVLAFAAAEPVLASIAAFVAPEPE